jgi:hypothetical protein
LAVLAGCTSGSQTGGFASLPNSAQQQSHSGSRAEFAEPASVLASAFGTDSDKGMTYVSQLNTTAINGYQRNNRANSAPVCTVSPVSNNVNYIAVDRSGNLWLPDEDARSVTEHGPKCGPLKTTLNDGAAAPVGVAFDANGHVYVANAYGGAKFAPGDVVQFTGTSMTKTLTDPDFALVDAIAVDQSNNVWITYRDNNDVTYVAEFPHGDMPATLFHNIVRSLPGGLQFDQSKNMLAIDPGTGSGVMDIYPPPYTQSKPKTQLALRESTFSCTLGLTQVELYCANATGSVDIYTYPAGKYLYSYTNGLSESLIPWGIANDPAPRN